MQSNAETLIAFSQNGFALSIQLSQIQVTYIAGYHETSVAYPLTNVWEEEVTKNFDKRPEAHGTGPNHEDLINE